MDCYAVMCMMIVCCVLKKYGIYMLISQPMCLQDFMFYNGENCFTTFGVGVILCSDFWFAGKSEPFEIATQNDTTCSKTILLIIVEVIFFYSL